MDEWAKLVEALTALIWPLIAGFLIWKIYPSLRGVMESRDFTIEVAGMKISAQKANEQLRTLVEDLQEQISELRKTVAGGPASPALRDGAGAAASALAAGAVSGAKRILWIDDVPENNAYEAAYLQDRGFRIATAASTDDGLRQINDAEPPFDIVISDLGRTEGGVYKPDAGLALLQAIRKDNPNLPVFIYASKRGVRRAGEALQTNGATGVTASPIHLFEMIAEAVIGA